MAMTERGGVDADCVEKRRASNVVAELTWLLPICGYPFAPGFYQRADRAEVAGPAGTGGTVAVGRVVEAVRPHPLRRV